MASKPKQKLSAAAKKRKYGGGHTSSSRLELNATCIIGTCDKGKENMATTQLLTWMQTYVDDMFPIKVEEKKQDTDANNVEEEDENDEEDDEKKGEDGSSGSDDDDDEFGDGSVPTSKRARITPPAAAAAAAVAVADDDDRPSSISSALAAELAALKEEEKVSRKQHIQKKGKEKSKNGKIKKPRARLESVDTKMKGLILIYIRDPTIQLVPLLTRMLTDVRIKKELSSRNIIRLEPVEKTCFAGLSELDTLCSTFLPTAFASLPSTITTHTFAIVLERRGHHDTMERNACIQTIAKHVPSPWTVNLTSPSVVIIATLLNRIAGLSVVTNYHELNKYNVRQLYEHAAGIQQEKKQQNQNKQKSSQNNNTNNNSTTSTETSTAASSNSSSSTSTSTSTSTPSSSSTSSIT